MAYSWPRFLCVILARGGSKGIPYKNIHLVAGKPLIMWTLEAALKSQIFDNIVVSTEDEKIRKTVENMYLDVEVIKRPDELAGDTVWSRDALKHAVLLSEKRFLPKGMKYELVVELPCVAPLRDDDHIMDAIELLSKNRKHGATAVTSVTKMQDKHPVRMKRILDDGTMEDFCKEFPEGEGSRRQDLESCYIRNGAIYAMTRDTIVEDFSRHGDKCLAYVMPEDVSVNVDTMMDLKLAEVLLNEKNKA